MKSSLKRIAGVIIAVAMMTITGSQIFAADNVTMKLKDVKLSKEHLLIYL